MSVDYTEKWKQFEQDMFTGMKRNMTDIKYDGTRVMRGSAPKKTGALERGITGNLKTSITGIDVVWGAMARGSNGFNYAVPMHNNTYNLGETSKMKPQVTSGLGMASFSVGNEYLKRPLDGLEQPYTQYLDKGVKLICDKYD